MHCGVCLCGNNMTTLKVYHTAKHYEVRQYCSKCGRESVSQHEERESPIDCCWKAEV